MSLLDELQGNLTDLKENIKVASKKITENSKEIKRQASLKLEIAKEERNLSDLYNRLGKEYYNILKSYSQIDEILIENYIKEIDASLAKIEGLKLKFDNFSGYTSTTESSYKINTEMDNKNNSDEDIIYIDDKDLR